MSGFGLFEGVLGKLEELVEGHKALRAEVSEMRVELKRTASGSEIPAFHTLEQAAVRMNRTPKTVRSYIARGLLEASRPAPGAEYVVTGENIERCMRGLNAEPVETTSYTRELTPEERAGAIMRRHARRASSED